MTTVELRPSPTVPWRAQAACRGMGTEIFFPVGSSDEVTEALAKKTCSRCAVRADCLSYAMETNQSEGIWGGLTPRERRSLRRKERRRAAG